MKYITLFLILLFCSTSSSISQEYIFFFHNRYLQEFGLESMHPEYGKVEYEEIVGAFRKQNFIVFNEVRKKGSSGDEYAQKAKHQIDSLLSKGVKPEQITVIGTSMGGYIAQTVSAQLKNKNIKYVFIGCCSDDDHLNPNSALIYGRILSIHEKSDVLGKSCIKVIEKSSKTVVKFKEIELSTGLNHGFLFKALPEWIEPCIKWAKGIEK